MKVSAVLTVVASILVSTSAFAQADLNYKAYGFNSAAEMDQYLTVSDVTIEETEVAQTASLLAANAPVDGRIKLGNETLDALDGVVTNPYNPSAWIALGKKAWEIVVKNEPVLNASTKTVSVLPASQPNWAQMANWKAPIARSYKIVAKNGFGVDAVSQTYTIVYNYGGSLNGKGQYLANATIIPAQIAVVWAYTLNSGVEVSQILNTGTVENPIPGVGLDLKYSISTLIKKSQNVDNFFVRGNGAMTHTTR